MTRSVRPPWVLLLTVAVPIACVGSALCLLAVDASPDVIVMVGPVQADEIRIVLPAVAAVSCWLGVTVGITRVMYHWQHPVLQVLGAFMMGIAWLAGIPFVAVVSLVAGLYLEDEPDAHRFVIDGRPYLLATQPQYDPATVSIALFRGDGRRFVRVDRPWPAVAPASVGRGEFTLVRRGGEAWIAYGRVRLPVT
ncbi:hypothetical protein [Aeromicrobium endophyticum]|uniref:Uncharacterized protein n=1 Tax=Aeromicrobium endophyticum TaxID=2292704 RepID=A0A371P2J8_9ACTN|nr:hypothetical protein [Aeromicrobium endophyticum]REK70115.1 hypothetical protein DX116_13160 [Aeromicrobium endophyticum]